MDRHYPIADAAAKLEEFARISSEALKAREQLNAQHLSNAQMEGLTVQEEGPFQKAWLLCSPADDDGTIDEVIFRMQGIVTRNDLVPKNVQTIPERKFKHLSQYMQICGLHTETFEAAISNVQEIHQRFSEHLCGIPINPHVDTQGPTGTVFSVSKRLFTFKANDPTEQDTEFSVGLDPMGYIARRKTSDIMHAPYNMVKSYKLVEGENDGESYFAPTIPGSFKIGDIVELQLSFVALLTFDKKVKLTNRLQAVTLLSDRFTKECNIARNACMAKPRIGPAIRRKVGVFYEDEADARAFKRTARDRDEVMQGDQL
ncbi:hypothetical protein DFH06DRAFT_1324036 [Mycena polygramma]|nr:hypothetical protein DFH06DRAFT_1324036 [Mycena polygramma]